MRKIIIVIYIVLSAAAVYPEEINFLYMSQSGYQPPAILDQSEQFLKETGVKVNVSFPQYKERYSNIVLSMEGKNPVFDVILVDLVWVRNFIKKGYLEPVPQDLYKTVTHGIIPEIYSPFMFKERLWAVPFHADFQLFYYNSRIFSEAGIKKPPKTLEQMIRIAKVIKKKGLIKYPIFDSWNKQEVLVCEYTWLTGAFGGDLKNEKGRINLLTKPSVRALKFMKNMLSQGLINPLSLKSDEMFAGDVFLSGDCAMTTNWTFLIESARKSSLTIKDVWRVSLIPVSESIYGKGRKTASISGFEGLGVTSRSKEKKYAWAFIKFLSRPDFQRKYLDYMSVWKDVWSEKKTLDIDPYIGLKEEQIKGVFDRPSSGDYLRISSILQKWIYKALIGEVEPLSALESAQDEIDEN